MIQARSSRARWVLLFLAASGLVAAASCRGCAERPPQRSAFVRLSLQVVGADRTEVGCRTLIRLRAPRSLQSAYVTLPGAPSKMSAGPFEAGEVRLLALPATPSGTCGRHAPGVTAWGAPGKPPAGWSAEFGLLGFQVLPLRGVSPAPQRRGASPAPQLRGASPAPQLRGTSPASQRSGVSPSAARCRVAVGLRVNRPGPMGPVLTLFDQAGHALAQRARLACGARAPPGQTVYCSAVVALSCSRVKRVVVTRGGATRPGRLLQSRRVIVECTPEGAGDARVLLSGQAPPSWVRQPGTVAYLLDLRGGVTSYAGRLRPLPSGEIRLHSRLSHPCVEASLLLLQRVAPPPAASRRALR